MDPRGGGSGDLLRGGGQFGVKKIIWGFVQTIEETPFRVSSGLPGNPTHPEITPQDPPRAPSSLNVDLQTLKKKYLRPGEDPEEWGLEKGPGGKGCWGAGWTPPWGVTGQP